jgi:hypothetical protein
VTPVSSPERPSKRPRQTLEVVIQRDPALHAHAVRSSTAAPDSEPNSSPSPSPSPSPGPRTRARTKIASNKTLKGSKLKKKKSSKRRTASPGFDANFPPPVRPHRGEQKGKQTTKTAREPPPNSYTNLVDAIRRGMSSLVRLLYPFFCYFTPDLCFSSSSLVSPVFASTRSARRGPPGSAASRASTLCARTL